MENIEYELGIMYYAQRLYETVKQLANERLKTISLTHSQAMVLMYLYSNKEKSITQKDIEKTFDITHPTVVGILKRMEQKGFVKVEIGETDRRQRNVFLTQKAEKCAQETITGYKDFEHIINEKMTTEQKKVLIEFFKITNEICKNM